MWYTGVDSKALTTRRGEGDDEARRAGAWGGVSEAGAGVLEEREPAPSPPARRPVISPSGIWGKDPAAVD